MIEARALVSINFLNLSENYDFMSRWLGVYDKYAKLLKGSSDVVVKDGSGKIYILIAKIQKRLQRANLCKIGRAHV